MTTVNLSPRLLGLIVNSLQLAAISMEKVALSDDEKSDQLMLAFSALDSFDASAWRSAADFCREAHGKLMDADNMSLRDGGEFPLSLN